MLRDWGIDWRVIDGPIGAASAVKMSYAGITKGTTAIAAAMLLGAARFGCAEALIAELSSSQPQMLARMRSGIPGMYDKAYRWVAEMEEISDFLEEIRRRVTCMRRSPGSTTISRRRTPNPSPAPTTLSVLSAASSGEADTLSVLARSQRGKQGSDGCPSLFPSISIIATMR